MRRSLYILSSLALAGMISISTVCPVGATRAAATAATAIVVSTSKVNHNSNANLAEGNTADQSERLAATEMHNAHKPQKQQTLTFVLVHGAWADAAFWDRTAEALRKQGHTVYAPEYAGHGSLYNPHVTHNQIADSVVTFIKDKRLKHFILVGHSFGGSVIQKVAEQVPERIQRLVFWDAFVVPDGQSVADQFPAPLRQAFQQLLNASGNRTINLPFPVFRDTFVNTATLRQAKDIYRNVKPEPGGPLFEPLQLKTFYQLGIPKSYLFLTSDIALPQTPFGFHPAQSSHLGQYRLILGKGDHMTAAFVHPTYLAHKLYEASRD
ncbi:acyl-CoA esterase [compost metagenome]